MVRCNSQNSSFIISTHYVDCSKNTCYWDIRKIDQIKLIFVKKYIPEIIPKLLYPKINWGYVFETTKSNKFVGFGAISKHTPITLAEKWSHQTNEMR